MNDADAELLLYRILSGKLIFFYNSEKYELRSPNYDIRYEAQLLYNKILDDEKYNQWIREEDLNSYLIYLGLWTKDTLTIIKDLEKKIDFYKIELYKSAFFPDKEKNNRKNLEQIRMQLDKIMIKKLDLLTHTLEGYASSIKNEYILCNTLYKNNKLIFIDNIHNSQSSYTYFNNLVNKINSHSISIVQFKNIARDKLWRSYWTCNKTNIFNKSIIDITDDQRTLINISRMYDSVYDHPECPNDKVINDDDMLDGWLLLQQRKAEQNKNQKRVDELNPKLKNAQEIFLMSDSKESFEEIMSLNSQESKNRIKEKTTYIDAMGIAKDNELPDVRRDIQLKANQIFKNKK